MMDKEKVGWWKCFDIFCKHLPDTCDTDDIVYEILDEYNPTKEELEQILSSGHGILPEGIGRSYASSRLFNLEHGKDEYIED